MINKVKTLVIEDDINWQKIFQILIEDPVKEVFEFTYVCDLASALPIIKNNNIDLIILDLILPDSYAINTIEIVTGVAKYIPIVVVSTLDDEKIMHIAFKHGVEDYLIKDQYDHKIFIHAVRQALRRFDAKLSIEVDDNIKLIKEKLVSINNKLLQFQEAS